jgi:hypothetical protein
MFEIEMTINGKPYSEATFEAEFENAVLDGVVNDITDAITSALTAEEAAKIKLRFKGTISESFGVEIDGPDDIVAKAAAALNDE